MNIDHLFKSSNNIMVGLVSIHKPKQSDTLSVYSFNADAPGSILAFIAIYDNGPVTRTFDLDQVLIESGWIGTISRRGQYIDQAFTILEPMSGLGDNISPCLQAIEEFKRFIGGL